MKDSKPRVSVIILNWNGWKDTLECLESLRQITYPNYDLVIVDNGSRDRSLEEIRRYLQGEAPRESQQLESQHFQPKMRGKPMVVWECTKEEAEMGFHPGTDFHKLPSNERMVLLKNDKNYGFAEGSNVGMRYALAALDPDYILLLNNDTIVKGDFLDELVKASESDEHVGFAGPIILYYDHYGRKDIISTAGGKLIMRKGSIRLLGQGEADQGQYNAIRSVDYAEGSCLLINRAVLDEIGLLDSSYFLYWEETDLCARGREAGYKCICVPTARIWHKVSASLSLVGKTYIYHVVRNRFWFMRSHATQGEFYLFMAYFFLRQFPINAWVYLKRRDQERLSAFLKGTYHGLMCKR